MIPPYVAQKFISGSPEAEILGQSALAFTENLKREMILPILEEHGLQSIKPESWYSQQKFMDVLRDVSSALNSMENLVAIGMKGMETSPLPPEVNSIGTALNMLAQVYSITNRNIPVGEGAVVVPISEKHYHIYHNTPYPDELFYGFIWGLTKRFKPTNAIFSVRMGEYVQGEYIGMQFDVKWGTNSSDL